MATIHEMISIIQIYIHHRKNMEVNIRIDSPLDIPKIIHAYDVAVKWLQENGFKQL